MKSTLRWWILLGILAVPALVWGAESKAHSHADDDCCCCPNDPSCPR
jgi:hypothetical protein